MTQRCWVISPNVLNVGNVGHWNLRIDSEKKVFVGYDSDKKHGDTFENKIRINDIVVIAKGSSDNREVFFTGIVRSERKKDDKEDVFYRELNYLVNSQILSKAGVILNSSNAWGDSNNPGAIYELHNYNIADKNIIDKLIIIMENKLKEEELQQKVAILKFKKQIILQGPPGTGKTKLAKEIAKALIGIDNFPSDDEIITLLKNVKKINTAAGNVEYELLKVDQIAKAVSLKKSTEAIATTSFDKIRIAYNTKCWERSIGVNDDRRACAIAKYLHDLHQNNSLNNKDNTVIVQFHPSYNYEDFVRGIIAESNGDKLEYKNVNKTLGLFAEKALRNFQNSNKIPDVISKEIWAEENYFKFKEYLDSELAKDGELLIKADNKPKITAIENDSVRVNRYSNEKDSVLIKDKDIINGYIGLNLSDIEVKIKENLNLSKSARSGMYYLYQNLVEKFRKYLDDNQLKFEAGENTVNVELRNYVLIIDEINRANLSSVLGELIYALEYRGKAVESMYAVDDNYKLILPPNLYIIGTMNTADRSVGHIDYAIRRRFAFVDVLPKDLSKENNIIFDSVLFEKVTELFIEVILTF